MNTNTYVHKSSILLFNNVKEYNERELFKSYIESLKLKELIIVLKNGNIYTECAKYIKNQHGVEMPDIQDERIKTLISELIKEKIDTNLKDIQEESRQKLDEILNKYKKKLNNTGLTTIPFNFNDDDADALQKILNEKKEEQQVERPVERPVELQDKRPVEQPVEREYSQIEIFKLKENYKKELQGKLNNLYYISNEDNETFKQTILGNIKNINNIDEDKKKGIKKLKDFLSLQSTKALDMNKIADYIITIGDPNIAEQLLTQPTPEFQIPVKTSLDTVLVGPGSDPDQQPPSVFVKKGYGPKPTQSDRFGAGEADKKKEAGAGAKAEVGAAGAAGEGGEGERERGDGERGEGERDEEEEAAKKKKKAEEEKTHTKLYDELSAIFAKNKEKMELVHRILTKKNKIAKINNKIKDGGEDNKNKLELELKKLKELNELLKKLNNSHKSNTDTYNENDENERIKKLSKISALLHIYISNISGGEKQDRFNEMLKDNMDESVLFKILEIPFPFQEEPAKVASSASPASQVASQVASPLLADKTTLLQTLSHQMLKEKLKSINDGNSSQVSEDDSSSASSSGSSSDDDDSAQSSVSDDTEGYESYVYSISSSEDEDNSSVNHNNLGPNKFQELSQKILQGKLTSLNIGESASRPASPASPASRTGSLTGSPGSRPASSESLTPSRQANPTSRPPSLPPIRTASLSPSRPPSLTGSSASSADITGSLQPSLEANIPFNVWQQKLSQKILREKLMSLKSEQRAMRKKGSSTVEEDTEESGTDATDSEDEGSLVYDNNGGPNKFQELSQKILQGKLTSLNIGKSASLQGNQSPSSASSQSGSPRSSHTGSPRSSLPASTEANIQFNVWHQQLSQNSLQGKLTSLASNNLLGSQLPSPVGSQPPIPVGSPVESQPPIPVGSPVESQPSSQVGSPTGSLAKSPTGSRSSSLTGSPTGSRSGSPVGSLQTEPITPQRGVKNSSDEPYLFKKYNDHTDGEYAIYYKDDNPAVNIANIKTDKCFNYFIYKKDDNIIIKPVKNYYSLTDILTIIYDEFQYIIIISKNTEKLYPGVLYQYKDYNKINLIFIYDNLKLHIIDDNFFDDTTNTEDGSFPIIPIGDDEYYQIKNEIYPDRQDTKSLSNISSALLRFKIKSIQRTQ